MDNEKFKVENESLQSALRLAKQNYQKQVETLKNEIHFLSLTKTRYPKFLDKPELYGANWDRLEDIPKLAKAVKEQALMNQAITY